MKKTQYKLLIILILGALVPLLMSERISVRVAEDTQYTQVLARTDAILKQKSSMIDQMLEKESGFSQFSAKMLAPQIVPLYDAFKQGIDSKDFRQKTTDVYPQIEEIKLHRNLIDVYLISTQGDVVFSLAQRADYGSNLYNGAFNQSELAHNVKQTISTNKTVISKFSQYSGSDNKFGIFISSPVSLNGETLGVLSFFIPAQKFNSLMNDYTGLQETGEAVLAIKTGDSAMFITPTRSDKEAAFQKLVKFDEQIAMPIQNAVQGLNGHGLSIDYDGSEILATWRYLPQYNLGMVVKLDTAEAYQGLDKVSNTFYTIAMLIIFPFLIFAYFLSARFSRPVIDIIASTNAMSNGNLDQSIKLRSTDEIGQLASSINEMSSHINRAFKEEESNRWLQHGVELLSETMRGNQISTDLADNIVAFVSNYLNAKVGSLYIVNDNEVVLSGGYAFVPTFGNQTIDIGDGLVGQVAISKQVIELNNVPEEYTSISSSLGEITPKELVIYPVVKDDVVHAIIELGWISSKHPQTLDFLSTISESVGIALSVADSHHKLQVLLDRSQQQMEELQVREEELRAINEEVEQRSTQLSQSQKELERQSSELKTTNDALEHKTLSLEKQNAAVEAKNAQIEQSKLELVVKAEQLEASSKYKSEFLANMSHELRTPLNSMLILSRILADNDDGNLDEDQIESAHVINNSGKQLLNLINDILDLSKIEAGKMEVNFEKFELSGIVNELYSQFNPVAKDKGIDLLIELDDDLPIDQMLDVQKTQQILKNLLSNALKFTEKGDVKIVATKAPSDRSYLNQSLNNQEVLAISVVDSGIGISEEKTKAIFEAFQQADGSTSRKYGGTGLGLTISRHLTDLIGGELGVVSEENVGSTFSLYLPIDSISAGEQTVEHQGTSSPNPPVFSATSEQDDTGEIQEIATSIPATTQDKQQTVEVNGDESDVSIVIIEDDVSFAKILANLAKKAGFNCVTAATGSEGLALIAQHKPTGVILDLGLPDMEGSDLLEQLKQDKQTKHIPVHIVSGQYKSQELTEKGADGFHQKPIEKQEIKELLSSFITKTNKNNSRQKMIIFDDNSTNEHLDLSFINHAKVTTLAVHSYDELSHNLGNSQGEIKGVIIKSNKLCEQGMDWLEHTHQFIQETKTSIVLFLNEVPCSSYRDKLEAFDFHVIINGSHSIERLHDEVSLFLSNIDPNSLQDSIKNTQVPVTIDSADSKPSKAITKPKVKPSSISPVQATDETNSMSVKDCNVLLVDDDLRNTFALSKVLKKQGMIVTLADNGQMALEKLYANDEIDIVLMDIMMPVMDGYEAMTKIRLDSKYEKLPIIALTAKAMLEDRRKCVEAGASDYLTKPVDVDKLVAMMKVWLYQEATQDE